MLMDDQSVKELLSRMVRKITTSAVLREDLLQEALVHLWLTENQRPGQTRSWYIQSCRFHLQHYLASGRSVDAAKRRTSESHFSFEEDGEHALSDHFEGGDLLLAQIGAREIISLLSSKLKPRAQAVLGCLAEGLGARDVARRLKISHPTAIKERRKIAALVLKLGISAPTNGHARQANGAAKANGAKHPLTSNGRNGFESVVRDRDSTTVRIQTAKKRR